MAYLAPILIGLVYVLLMCLVREPHRRRLNAVVVAGAGAAYLSGGGLGGWEFAFTALLTYVAYRGLDSWTFVGLGWLLHTAWDVVHHLKGNPIVPFAHDSSLGCAICDPVIALWCLGGGRTPRETVRAVRLRRRWTRVRADAPPASLAGFRTDASPAPLAGFRTDRPPTPHGRVFAPRR